MRFAARMVSGALAAIWAQYSRVNLSRSETGTTWWTSPMSFASCAVNCRPVIMISRAYGAPTVSTRFFIDEAR